MIARLPPPPTTPTPRACAAQPVLRTGQIPSPNHVARLRQRGFTVVELLITVVVLGVLMAVAYPSYLDSIRKSRRAEGIAALTAVQQAQERFRANNPSYGDFVAQPGPPQIPALPNAAALATSSNGRYAIAVTVVTPTSYTVEATAGGAQASDTACAVMGVQATGGNLRYGSGATSINWAATNADAGRCWAQ